MKNSYILISTVVGAMALTTVAALGDSSLKLHTLQSASPIETRLPLTPDTTGAATNTFKTADILNIAAPKAKGIADKGWQAKTSLEADTAGMFSFELPASDAKIYRVETSITPENFFSGKVKVDTKAPAAVYIDGEKTTDLSPALKLKPYQTADIKVVLLAQAADTILPTLSITIAPDKDSEDIKLIMDGKKRRYDITATTEGPRVGSVAMSPDGKYLIVSYSTTYDGKKYAKSADILHASDMSVVQSGLTTSPAWLPGKSSTIYFKQEDASGKSFSLLTLDLNNMKQGALAQGIPSEASDFQLSPNADFIIFSVSKEGEKPSGIMRRVEAPDDRIPGNRDRSYLSIYRFDEQMARPLTYGGASTLLCDISPKGDKMLYMTITETPDHYPFYDYALIQTDITTLANDTIFSREISLTNAVYSPDGSHAFITAGPNGFGGIGKNCGDHPIANDYDIQGYIVDLKSHDIKAMTRDFDPSLSGLPIWHKADGKIYFRAEKGFDCLIYTLDPKSGKIEQLPTDIDYIRQFSIGNDESKYLAYTGMGYSYVGRAKMLDLPKGTNRMIADPMAPAFEQMAVGKSEMWGFKAEDGTPIECTVTYPADFDPSKKYPMIVYYYAGTTPSTHTSHSPYTPNLFAAGGYVVLVVNPSGAIGYGQEFSARHVNAWGERTADEIILGTKLFCDSHSFVDSKKIGCIGASYGGFMTELLTTKTDIFSAAVSHAGISNVASYWGEGFWGYSYNAVAAAKSYPWSDPQLFTRNSALFNADKIHTPLLLLHGSVDTNVPIGESIQLFNALRILDRPVEFVTIDGENHIVMDYEKRKEWHATIMAWFEKWLCGDSRWWNSIYGN